jgi:hypothetical protein
MTLNLDYPFSIIITGMPGAGKTGFIKYIFLSNHPTYKEDPFKYGIVFTNTKFDNEYDYCPQKYVHAAYNEDILRNFIELQKENSHHKTFIVFDDCLDKKAFQSKLFTELVTQYRHLNINLIITAQYLKLVTPAMKECCRYAILLKSSTEDSIKSNYESFGFGFSDRKKFEEYIRENCVNYGAILVDRRAKQDEPLYQVKRAPDPKTLPKFTYKF